MRSWEPQQTKTVLFSLSGTSGGPRTFLPCPPFLAACSCERPPRREATLAGTQKHARRHTGKRPHAQRLRLGRSRTTRRKATGGGQKQEDRTEGTTIAFVLALPGLIETWATANAHRWGMRRAREALGGERQSAARIARSGKERARDRHAR